MARLRTGRHRSTLGPLGRYSLDLEIGPTSGVPGAASIEELELAWELYGPVLMARRDRLAGIRPWAWWQFERREPRPRGTEPDGLGDRDAETIRLAELGELTQEELAGLEEAANVARLRIGTDGEHLSGCPFRAPSGRYPGSLEDRMEGCRSVDVDAVLLWDAIVAARAARAERGRRG